MAKNKKKQEEVKFSLEDVEQYSKKINLILDEVISEVKKLPKN